MRRMLEVRKQHPVFGAGRFEVLSAENPSVLAYVRSEGDDIVLCVNNLSRFAQPVEMQLQRWEGRTPISTRGFTQRLKRRARPRFRAIRLSAPSRKAPARPVKK